MGANLSDTNVMKEVQSHYVVLRSVTDPRYGEGRIIQSKAATKEELLLKEINMTDETQYAKWKKKFEARVLDPHPNLINLIKTYSQQDSQFCGAFFKFYLVLDYVEHTLTELIAQHKMQQVWISEHDMWVIVKGSVEGLSRLQQNHITHQALRPGTISMKQESRHVKLCDPTLLNTISSFASIIQDFSGDLRGIYISPLQIKALGEGSYQPRHNAYKSDVFCLGMTLLHAGTLEPCDSCYHYETFKFVVEEMERQLAVLNRYYSPELCGTIKAMLCMDEEQRPDFVQLKQELSSLRIPDSTFKSVHHATEVDSPQQALQHSFAGTPQNNQKVQPGSVRASALRASAAQSQDTQITLQLDLPDQLNPQQLRFEPSKHSTVDENIGNEIGQQQEESPPPKQMIRLAVENLSSQQYQPITARSPISYNTNNDYQKLEFERVRESQLKQASSIHLNAIPNQYVGSYVQQTQTFIQQEQRYTDRGETQRSKADPNKYNYLYDNQLNTAEKMSTYQEDLTKKFATKTPNKFDEAVKVFEHQHEKESVIETYQNGSRYEGEKMNGMRHGRGRFYYQDGGVYDGEWSDNKMHGKGTLYYASSRPAYEGQWIDDKFEGEGTLYNELPQVLVGDFDPLDMEEIGEYWTTYQGGFHDDNKEGMGTLQLSNGDTFYGYFLSDMASGPGKYITKKGRVTEGHWWHNKLQY